VPHTLLLADDSVTIQRVIELTFADEDIAVVAVSDGDQAIARLDAAPPDIVLADVGMPGKNGYEVAQYVKQSPRLAHIPVVLLTGAFEPVDHARANDAGCDGVLAKPFEPQLVISRVKELLAQNHVAAARSASGELDMPLASPSAPVESWPPLAEQPLDPVPAPAPADLSNYFDRLDAAFADLSSHPASAPVSAEVASIAEPPAAPIVQPAAAVSDEIDWFGTAPADSTSALAVADQIAAHASVATEPEPVAELVTEPQVPDIPVSYASPAPAVTPSASAGQAAVAPLPEKPVALPSLADAFAVILAAEQNEPSTAPVVWPVSAPSTDALVDQIGRRVLDQIAPRIESSVRAAVADLVSELAERLIREEIERIKAALK